MTANLQDALDYLRPGFRAGGHLGAKGDAAQAAFERLVWHDYGEGFTDAPAWGEVDAAMASLSSEQDKAGTLGRIAATRYEHETGGTTVDGMHVATDRQSQALITGAFSSAKDAKETGEPFSIRWKSAGGWVELDADQMIGLGRAVRAHVQACFDREKELTEAVADGTFEESMLDEDWPE